MTKSAEKKATRVWPVIRAYSKAASKYPGFLTMLLVGGLAIELTSVGGPLVMREFINTLSTHQPSPETMQSLLLLLAVFGLVLLFGWSGQRVRLFALTRLEIRAMVDLSHQAFSYLLGHSYDYFTSNFTGTLTRRVNRYAQSFEKIVDQLVFNFYSTFLFAVGVIIILSLRNIWLGLGLLLWTIVFTLVQIHMTRKWQPLRIEKSEHDSKLSGTLSDSVSNHSAITLFAARKHEQKLFAGVVGAWRDATARSWSRDNWNYAVQGLFVIAMELGLFIGGVFLWAQGTITVGDFVLIQVYMIGLIDRVWGIGNTMRHLYDSFADAYEMIEIFETPHGVRDVPGAIPLVVTRGSVEFKDVVFNFNQTRTILDTLSLSIEPYQKVALVGPSGAGKTTITKLLLRLYDVSGGEVLIDGQNIGSVTQESLREAISFVPQEPSLFHRSLMDNIRYGRQSATDEEVIEAAKKAHCHEFIDALPEKYETHVGERGVKLSGGERQRVAIARAILKNAPILVLDEATSALDSESESLIQDALKTLMEGKTVIVIAHRLSTIMKMDRIIVIEDGKIAADGTHDELLKEGGLYHKLWSIQAGSFLADDSEGN